jgi:hypothetical protein
MQFQVGEYHLKQLEMPLYGIYNFEVSESLFAVVGVERNGILSYDAASLRTQKGNLEVTIVDLSNPEEILFHTKTGAVAILENLTA